MSLSVLILIIAAHALYASATTPSHDFHYIYGCYESDDVRVDVVVDDEVAAYADFTNEEIEWAIPHLPQFIEDFSKRVYEIAKTSIAHCHSVLNIAKRADPGAPKRQDAPNVLVHTRYEGEEGMTNTLLCLANHFYPPTLNFTWTKNGVEVTQGVSHQRYRHNGDGTFYRLSTLSFIPREGDVYLCSVEHQASQQPLTGRWELEGRKRSVSPAAGFFMASLVLCLIGVGTGAFFFSK